tara:strand:+ start:1444 stop:2400 length:957 start_codon:yes stop_codon:yes gene_type:complete
MDGSIDSVADSLIVGNESEKNPTDEDLLDQPEEESNEADPEDDGEDLDDTTDDEPDDQDEDEAEEAEDAGQQELYTVKVDGEEREVTLDDLKQSFSGQAYIQKGMKEASEAKKEAEGVYQALLNERQQLSHLLQQAQTGQIANAPVPPSRELFNNDPIGYMDAKLSYDEAMQNYQNQQYQIQQVTESQNQQMQIAQQHYLQGEMQQLAKVIPEFGDAKTASKLKEDLVHFGSKLGYSESELSEVMDHRAILVLQKAMKYDQLVEGKSKATQKASNARPMVKPGTKKTGRTGAAKQRQNAQARMNKTGSIDDVAKFLLS